MKIAPHFLNLGLNCHGTRVLQKLIDVVYQNNKLFNFYLKILSPYFIICFINDVNGNHIIQKLVVVLGFPRNKFIYEIIKENIIEIAMHKHGCCVLQKCIENANILQKVS